MLLFFPLYQRAPEIISVSHTVGQGDMFPQRSEHGHYLLSQCNTSEYRSSQKVLKEKE